MCLYEASRGIFQHPRPCIWFPYPVYYFEVCYGPRPTSTIYEMKCSRILSGLSLIGNLRINYGMHCCSICLVVCLFLQCQSFVNQTSDKLCIYRDLVPLEAFWICYWRNIGSSECTSRRQVSEGYGSGFFRNYSRLAPEAIMDHTQCSSSVLVIMGKASGIEELHHSRFGCWFHPYKRCQTVTVNAHHDLEGYQYYRMLLDNYYIPSFGLRDVIVLVSRACPC